MVIDRNSEELKQALLKQANLPSFPGVLIRIYEKLEQPTSTVEELAELLSTDSGLTARALKLGNSALYGSAVQREISNLSEVMMRIGAFDLWSLLMATEAKLLFYGVTTKLIDMEQYWEHCLFTASASKVVSSRIKVGNPNDLFITGLLHDVGKLLLLMHKPIEYEAALRESRYGIDGCTVEENFFGFNHADLGADLLADWGLAPSLVNTIRYHHHAETELLNSKRSIINYADQIAHYELKRGSDHTEESGISGELAIESRNLFNKMSCLVA